MDTKERKKPVRKVFGRLQWVDGPVSVTFTMTEAGREVRRGGSAKVQTVPFEVLARLSQSQPLLFSLGQLA